MGLSSGEVGAQYRRREGVREDHLSGRGQAGGWHDWTQILWRWCPEAGDTAHPLNTGTDGAGKRQTSRYPARVAGLGDPRSQHR